MLWVPETNVLMFIKTCARWKAFGRHGDSELLNMMVSIGFTDLRIMALKFTD